MKKKLLSMVLVTSMLLVMMQGVVYGDEILLTTTSNLVFEDMPNDWSTTALENAVKNGLLQGYNGKIRPNDNLTRAQMAAVINRAFGATDEADISEFTDVSQEDWYYSDMAKAVSMETFQGNGSDKLYPDNGITRQEVCVVLANAFKLSSEDTSSLDGFADADQVSTWATNEMAALVEAGYIAGSSGNLNPKESITRAEFAQLMDNILKNYIKEAGTYEEDLEGSVIINVADVTLKDLTITGDLIIGDGVGDGDVTLESVVVTGRTVIRGGGVNTIKITGASIFTSIIIARVNGEVRVYNEDGVEIGEVIVDGKDDVIIEGDVGSVIIMASDVTVTTSNAAIETVTVAGENADIVVNGGGSIETIVANAEGTQVSGTGDVGQVQANANNINVLTEGTQVEASEGTSGVTAGTTPVEAGDVNTVATSNDSSGDDSSDDDSSGDDSSNDDSSNDSDSSSSNDDNTTSSNNPPTVASGQETQSGTATAPTSDGSTTAVAFTADISTWFEDGDNDALSYSVVSATNNGSSVKGTVDISGTTITYTPEATHGGYETQIKVKANDGNDDSTSNVTINVAVTAVMETQGTKVKLDGNTWVVDDTNGTHIGIWSVEDLQEIGVTTAGIYDTDSDGSNADEAYVLMADIDFNNDDCYRDVATNKATYTSNEGFDPIGYGIASTQFRGTFDGNGHIISNLFINRGSEDYIGLFGSTYGATIENIGINNCDLTGSAYVGGLVGYNISSTMSGIYVTGDVTGNSNDVGGLVGSNSSSMITSSYATVGVTGNSDDVGGLVGSNYSSTITLSYATGDVTGSGNDVGGLVGYNSSSTITSSYATGDVTGSINKLGGLVGYNYFSTVTSSYATGNTTGSGIYVGGLVGSCYSGTLENSIAFNSSINNINGNSFINKITPSDIDSTVANNYSNENMLVNGIIVASNNDITLAEFGTKETYTNKALNWDFENTWEIISGADRPTLIGIGKDDGLLPNNVPIIVSGQETQVGTASVVSSGYVETYTADMSSWFTDYDGEALTYAVVSAMNNGGIVSQTVSISGTSITYTPEAAHVGYDTEIKVIANDGEGDSESSVTILVSVTDMYAQGTKVKLEGDTWVVDDTNGTHIGIWSVEDLQLIAVSEAGIYDTDGDGSNLDEVYVLMTDIDFESEGSYRDSDANQGTYIPDTNSSNEGFDPIGDVAAAFEGSFNGNDHIVSHLYINRTADSDYYIGLFGNASNAVIKNMGVDSCNITGYSYVGGLAGYAGVSSTISGIYVTGEVSASYHRAGGLVGGAGYLEITKSYATATVTGGYNNVGGLVGYCYGSKISESYGTGTVNGEGINVGGLVGATDGAAEITKCYATGNVEGENNSVGGLVGSNGDSSKITECYTTGNVTGTNTAYAGGLVGKNSSSSTIENCIAFNSTISGTGDVGRVTGYNDNGSTLTNNYANENMTGASSGTTSDTNGADLTEAEFKTLTSYDNDDTDGTPALNWDFSSIWEILSGADRPTLKENEE